MTRKQRRVLVVVVLLLGVACGDDASHDSEQPDSGEHEAVDSGKREVRTDASVMRDARADSPATDAGFDANSADGGAMGGATIDVCGTRVAIAQFTAAGHELIVDAVTQAWSWGNPLAGPPSSPLSRPRYDAARMPWIERGACDGLCSFDTDAYAPGVFGAEQTDYALLVPDAYSVGNDGTDTLGFATLSNEEAASLRKDVNAKLGAERVRLAVAVMPNDRIDLQLEAMDRWASEAAAWSLMPAWSPSYDDGYALDDPEGEQTIEHGLALHVPIFIVDKGMPAIPDTPADPRDIGPAAKAYPDARLVVRHAAFEHGLGTGETSDPAPEAPKADLGWGPGVGQWPEGPYDETDAEVQAQYPLTRGVNSLIKSLRDNGVGPNANVYASLDEVWAHLITRPTEAAHVLGKLLLYIGEDNILWATDSMLYGKPDPQVRAFRDFQIPAELRKRYGYPELTPERKAKIFGLNAARLFCLTPR